MADSLDVSMIEILSEHIHREMQPTGQKGKETIIRWNRPVM